MKEYVLDTHAFAWWAAAPKKLGKEAARCLREVDRGQARVWLPSIIGVELVMLAETKRRVPTVADLEAATRRNREVRILPHDLAQSLEFALLGSLGDPFDRMIVAAARATKRPLITGDGRIAESGLVDVVWA